MANTLVTAERPPCISQRVERRRSCICAVDGKAPTAEKTTEEQGPRRENAEKQDGLGRASRLVLAVRGSESGQADTWYDARDLGTAADGFVALLRRAVFGAKEAGETKQRLDWQVGQLITSRSNKSQTLWIY